MTNYLNKNHKGFSPVILIIVFGAGILALLGILYLRVTTGKNIAASPKPSQIAFVTPTPSTFEEDSSDADNVGDEEGDSVLFTDLEGPD